MSRILGVTGVFFALSLAAAAAEDPAGADGLKRLDSELSKAEQRLDGLSREYGDRRGLLGADEAQQRFEDAVYDYLMGDYKVAAMGFYALVESEALVRPELAMDAHYYLAECLFEYGNYRSALAAYQQMSVPSNPFYADAVRRQLEIYGIMKDHEGFYQVYRDHILSGKVPANDAVKYTVARSFYHQGDMVRAKSMFAEIALGSEWYGRAHYHLGTILATEGDLQGAVAQFQQVLEQGKDEKPRVLELARLALGRLYYEIGDYPKATEYYQQIGAQSDFFADQLYELVWTYIKQEQWDNALRHLEIFLIAFPDHAYTLQMKILQGHLYMKEKAYERALVSYENLVQDYTPLHERLSDLESSREDPSQFFKRIVAKADADDDYAQQAGEYDLPAYAVQMLVEDKDMARVVGAKKQLGEQKLDLDQANGLIDEVDEALANSGDAIGTFSRGRAALRRVDDDALYFRGALIDREIAYLIEQVPTASRPKLRDLRREWEVLRGRAEQVQGAESARTDRYQVHEDQVREVQRVAGRVEALTKELQAEVSATRRVLSDKHDLMTANDVRSVEEELDEVDRRLERAQRDLQRLGSDATRRVAMASVALPGQDSGGETRGLIVQDYDGLWQDLRTWRRQVSAPERAIFFAQLDGMWGRVGALENGSAEARETLNHTESVELVQLQRQLSEEVAEVRTLTYDVDDTTTQSEDLAVDITRSGFGKLDSDLSDAIMRADMGIVDVYWLRKTAVSDEMTRLAKERGMRIQELDKRFDVIRQKLEE